MDDKFLAKVAKCGIVDAVTSFSRFKDDQMLKKQSGTKTARKLDIPKLDDANYAGTRQSQKCTLIITEGDSAKSTVIGGIGPKLSTNVLSSAAPVGVQSSPCTLPP